MKIALPKFKRNSKPDLNSLHQPIFDVTGRWFLLLGIFVLMLIVVALIGLKLFYSVFFENYKNTDPASDTRENINTTVLLRASKDRRAFLAEPFSAPRDPSL